MSADDTDLLLTEDRGTKIDEGTGDFATVTGKERILQSIVVSVLNDTSEMRGEAITKADVENFTGEIKDGLRKNEFADPPYRVRISEINDESIEFAISTKSEALTHTYSFN